MIILSLLIATIADINSNNYLESLTIHSYNLSINKLFN